MPWMLCCTVLMLCSRRKPSSSNLGLVLAAEGSQLSLTWNLLSISLELSLAKENFFVQVIVLPQEQPADSDLLHSRVYASVNPGQISRAILAPEFPLGLADTTITSASQLTF